MEDIHSTIAEGRRIVIPADYRRALGPKVGDEVILRMADREVHILTRRQAIKKAQALVKPAFCSIRTLTCCHGHAIKTAQPSFRF